MKTFRPTSAFTLIELLVTISIIGMLATMLVPQVGKAIEKARSVACANNLRQIGIAVQSYAGDNDNRFPMIESMPSNPVYSSDEKAGTLVEVLGPYGITPAVLKCPTDVIRKNYFQKEGTSYMWRPTVDDELVTAPKVYRRGQERVMPLSRTALATDFEGRIHTGHINCLFADGHVRTF